MHIVLPSFSPPSTSHLQPHTSHFTPPAPHTWTGRRNEEKFCNYGHPGLRREELNISQLFSTWMELRQHCSQPERDSSQPGRKSSQFESMLLYSLRFVVTRLRRRPNAVLGMPICSVPTCCDQEGVSREDEAGE